jgi:hypothetical protein
LPFNHNHNHNHNHNAQHRKMATRPTKRPKRLASSAFEDSIDMTVDPIQISTSGRPLRKNAGRRTIDPNYVNSTDNINDAIGDLKEESKIAPSKFKKPLRKKRMRSLSPPPLSPLSVDFPTEAEFLAQEDPVDPYITMASGLQPINLTFNIPQGFNGLLKVQIDPATLLRLSTPPSTRQQSPAFPTKRQCFGLSSPVKSECRDQTSPTVASFIMKNGPPRGFCDLPPGT